MRSAFTPIPLAAEALSSLFPYSDDIAFYTQTFEQVFKHARPIKVAVKPAIKAMEHPLETGATVTDHRIVLPKEIEVSFIIPPATYRDTYQTINNYFVYSILLIVQTRASVYYNMMITSIPHEESADMYNAIPLAMTLKEVLFAETQTSNTKINPKSPKNSGTVPRGQQNTTVVKDRSVASKITGLR